MFNMLSKIKEDNNNLNTGITERISKVVEKVYSDIEIDISIFNYMIFGILVSLALRMSGGNRFELFVFSIMFT